MCYRLVLIALALIFMAGCSERYGGPIFPIPQIPVEHPSSPDKSDVLEDLAEVFGDDIVNAEKIEEIHEIEAHVFFVKVLRDGDVAMWIKAQYYFVDGQWVCIPDQIEI